MAIRYENQNALMAVRYENQNTLMAIRHENLNALMAIRYSAIRALGLNSLSIINISIHLSTLILLSNTKLQYDFK